MEHTPSPAVVDGRGPVTASDVGGAGIVLPHAAENASRSEEEPVTMPEKKGSGTSDDPWVLHTPPQSSSFLMYRDEEADPPVLVCTVGKTVLHYDLRIIDDMHAMLKEHGGWMPLGNADEQKPAADGTVEAWARSSDNPIGGWYGLKKGLRGRVGNYVTPVLEVLGLVELEHNPRNNRARAS